MTLSPWRVSSVVRPDFPASTLAREINRMMESVLGPTETETSEPLRGSFQPPMSLKETPNSWRVSCELPGLSEKDVEITFHQNTLTLKGEKSREKDETEETHHRCERLFGKFQRTITFPGKVDPEKIEAHFRNGLLCIDLAKADESLKEARRIAVKSI